jgi:hypothetical protein
MQADGTSASALACHCLSTQSARVDGASAHLRPRVCAAANMRRPTVHRNLRVQVATAHSSRLRLCVSVPARLCACASVRLCVSAPALLCACECLHLRVSAPARLCTRASLRPRVSAPARLCARASLRPRVSASACRRLRVGARVRHCKDVLARLCEQTARGCVRAARCCGQTALRRLNVYVRVTALALSSVGAGRRGETQRRRGPVPTRQRLRVRVTSMARPSAGAGGRQTRQLYTYRCSLALLSAGRVAP